MSENISIFDVNIPELLVRVKKLAQLLEWIADTVHQTYHVGDSGGWQECTKPLCREIRKTLEWRA